jgi:hypothetical protein
MTSAPTAVPAEAMSRMKRRETAKRSMAGPVGDCGTNA